MWRNLLLVALLAFVLPKVYKFIKFQGYHVQTYNHRPGSCRVVGSIVNGSEDIQVLPSGKVLITSGIRFGNRPSYEGVVGRVYEFNPSYPDNEPIDVTIQGALDLDTFNPLGLGAWTENEDMFIYIVNVLKMTSAVVEVFQYYEEKTTLNHLETIRDPNFAMLNNLIITGRRQFYFTNFLNNWEEWEVLLMLYRGNAGYYDGTKSKIVADQMLMPNGIALSPDEKYVYINHIFEKEVRIYERLPDNHLSFKHAEPVYMCPDNLYVDASTGDIWLAGAPEPYSSRQYLENPKHVQTPSQVLRLRMKDGSVTSMEQVFSDDGRLISGSSVAVYTDGKLVIGAVATSPVYCDVKYIMS